jgi:hypothetical protein
MMSAGTGSPPKPCSTYGEVVDVDGVGQSHALEYGPAHISRHVIQHSANLFPEFIGIL